MSYVNRPQLNEHEMEQKLSEVRNRVTEKMGKWADRIQVSMAYKPTVDRQEGERWEEGGKTYIRKNGANIQMSIMEAARMPWHCPRCEKSMNHRFDRKFFYLRGWCYDCNIKIEGQMRVDGTFERFERQVMRRNEVAFLRDKIEEHLTYIREFKEPTVYFENGGYEVIAKKEEFQDLFDQLLADVDFMLARLEVIKAEEEAEQLAEASNESIVEAE